ncbi:MAG TPA: hypothetical protein DCZ94_03260 [Lentisphaeria bacterium]|nr:MAG: hypothetical protein A2X48_19435 [Lentisphaerae bacterium GWF2_49_21]HBC85953.1 hypothetical protein [Lentisphaeria bacterium]
MFNDCIFSPDRKYRYVLKHRWDDLMPEKACMWIGLNPSTADEQQLDPTLRRIRGFCITHEFNCFYMLNIFAFRATDPKIMKKESDPTGPENDRWLKEISDKCTLVVACWGTHGKHIGRSDAVIKLFSSHDKTLHCLGKTKEGYPVHPLYIPADAELKAI